MNVVVVVVVVVVVDYDGDGDVEVDATVDGQTILVSIATTPSSNWPPRAYLASVMTLRGRSSREKSQRRRRAGHRVSPCVLAVVSAVAVAIGPIRDSP